MGTKKPTTAEQGEAAVEKLRPILLAIENDRVLQPNTDLQSAAMASLVLVDRARQSDYASKVSLLPKELYEKNTVDKLEEVANATIHIEVESSREGAASTGVKVDLAIVQEGGETRERMLKTVEYNLGDNESVAREVADIRSGTGYLDLANDLARLAILYVMYKSALSADKKYYDPADAATANNIAAQIRDAYRAASGRVGEYADLRARAYTELVRLHSEVRSTAQFVLRAQPDAVSQFLALRTGAKAVGPARRSKRSGDATAPSAPTAPTAPITPTAPAASSGGASDATATNGSNGS